MRSLLALALAAMATGAAAQNFPDRPITLVHPYAPGSAAVGFGRALADRMSQDLGQPIIHVHRDGGSGVVGMRSVALSPPDGHTFGLTPVTATAVQPHLLRDAGTQPDRFSPICGINENVIGAFVRADSPIRDLPGLVAAGRARPLSFGSPGPNSLPQLAMWRVTKATGVAFNHIPYRGDPPHLNDLAGGRTDFSAGVVASAAALIEGGLLRPIVVFSEQRTATFPDVPTAREQGIDALQFSQVGLYAAANTPVAILDKLEAACLAGLRDPTVLRIAAAARVVVRPMGRTDFTRLVHSEYAAYGVILRELGVQAE